MNTSDTGTLTGVISGGAGGTTFTKVGDGTLILSGTNTYGGATAVNNGVLSIADVAGLGNTTGTTVADGATLDINFASDTLTLTNTNAIALNGAGFTGTNGALTLTSNKVTLSNNISLDTDSTIGLNSSVGTLNGIISGNALTLRLGATGVLNLGGLNSFSAIAIGTGNLSVTSSGALGIIPIAVGSADGETASLILNGSGITLNNNITLFGGATLV